MGRIIIFVCWIGFVSASDAHAQDNQASSGNQAPQSGLPVGAEVSAWNPIHYSGPDAGTKHCPVCTHLEKPVVLVFGKQTLNTIALARQLESLAANSEDYLKCFVILTDGTQASAEMLVRHYRFRHVGICLLDPETRPEDLTAYKINERFENTVLYYRDYLVKSNLINLQSPDIAQLAAVIENSAGSTDSNQNQVSRKR